MGSLLNVIAVTVTANAPAVVEGAAVKVKTAWPPMMPVLGENDAVTPLGKPLRLRATAVPYRPTGAWNETLVLVR
jgi:hypothetical protein